MRHGRALSHVQPGPQRFFYDETSYTRVHKYGGAHIPKLGGSAEGILPEHAPLLGADLCEANDQRYPFFVENQVRGPDRLFYDRASYTGAPRFGGPDRTSDGRYRNKPPLAREI